jgi:ankyrin repeat protein
VAAAFGWTDDARGLIATASAEERHLGLALAAQFGRVDIVRLLADAGEELSRFNPVGAHAHSTPLHQAALAGHSEVARLLVERGARRDIRDTTFQGTPAGWARHGGHAGLGEFLES